MLEDQGKFLKFQKLKDSNTESGFFITSIIGENEYNGYDNNLQQIKSMIETQQDSQVIVQYMIESGFNDNYINEQ